MREKRIPKLGQMEPVYVRMIDKPVKGCKFRYQTYSGKTTDHTWANTNIPSIYDQLAPGKRYVVITKCCNPGTDGTMALWVWVDCVGITSEKKFEKYVKRFGKAELTPKQLHDFAATLNNKYAPASNVLDNKLLEW